MNYRERFVSSTEQTKKQETHDYYVDLGYELPKNYSREGIVAMVRDPECIFTYWSFSDLSKFDKEKISLRVNNISDGKSWLIKNTGCADNWYIAVESDKEYLIELCYEDKKGITVLMRSNKVKTPRDKISGHQKWVEENEFLRLVESIKKQVGMYWSDSERG